MTKVLITGGAGFIGSFLADALVEAGHEVAVLDSLEPQVHGDGDLPPECLCADVAFHQGSIDDPEALGKALEGAEVLFHEAALVGVAQSMYEIERYAAGNTAATARMLQHIVDGHVPLKKIIVASSMSLYGEGAYECPSCGVIYPRLRGDEQLENRQWEMLCPSCGRQARPLPTTEDKPLAPTSVYAVTKRDHEELVLAVGAAYGIQATALRYFNVYGPRQALSNPYTGVVAIFSSCLLNDNVPGIFEDGLQSRDFIHVRDVARANLLAMECDEADGQAFNIATGSQLTILEIARTLAAKLGKQHLRPRILGTFRSGDIRHCFADVSKARRILGFEAAIPFGEGIDDLIQWLATQSCRDLSSQAQSELNSRGLTH